MSYGVLGGGVGDGGRAFGGRENGWEDECIEGCQPRGGGRLDDEE